MTIWISYLIILPRKIHYNRNNIILEKCYPLSIFVKQIAKIN